MLAGTWRKGNSHESWWEYKLVQLWWKTVWRSFKTLKQNYHIIQKFKFWVFKENQTCNLKRHAEKMGPLPPCLPPNPGAPFASQGRALLGLRSPSQLQNVEKQESVSLGGIPLPLPGKGRTSKYHCAITRLLAPNPCVWSLNCLPLGGKDGEAPPC